MQRTLGYIRCINYYKIETSTWKWQVLVKPHSCMISSSKANSSNKRTNIDHKHLSKLWFWWKFISAKRPSQAHVKYPDSKWWHHKWSHYQFRKWTIFVEYLVVPKRGWVLLIYLKELFNHISLTFNLHSSLADWLAVYSSGFSGQLFTNKLKQLQSKSKFFQLIMLLCALFSGTPHRTC